MCLFQVKSLFKTSDKYAKFCNAIKEYKTAKDVQKLASVLGNIFADVAEKPRYIHGNNFILNFNK